MKVTDPKGPDAVSIRIFRGGAWYCSAGVADNLVVSYRYYAHPIRDDNTIGFRIVCNARKG